MTSVPPGGTRRPPIEHCCPDHRLVALDALETAIFNDTTATFDFLVDASDGCSLPTSYAMDELVETYKPWLVRFVSQAVDDAISLLRAEVSA